MTALQEAILNLRALAELLEATAPGNTVSRDILLVLAELEVA